MASGRVLLVVFDGLGFNRERAHRIASAAFERLPAPDQSEIENAVKSALRNEPACSLSPADLYTRALFPVFAETLAPDLKTHEALAELRVLEAISERLPEATRTAMANAVQEAAREQRYVPWIAYAPKLARLRNENLSVPTSASGLWAGFEDVVPPVQGNSDTGHQQIGNLRLAPQTPLEITQSIESGEFFKNAALVDTVREGKRCGALNFCFMLSGIGGADGRVHSAWNHLEAFLKLVFEQEGLTPEQVRMEAILDGRDCPTDSSIVPHDNTGDYVGVLEELLGRYHATVSLKWVIGRNIAMDRDFNEANVEADYELLTHGKGQRVDGFAGLRSAIHTAHESGKGDSAVPPIALFHGGEAPAVIGRGEAFVNLNFRADRQRAKTAVLMNARDFLNREANSRNRPWKMDWLGEDLGLTMATLADYHPELVKAGARAAFPAAPQPDNLLALLPQIAPGRTYSLIGESNKSAHMGFFIRGRREDPVAEGLERRTIVPSTSAAEGVSSDADFYKTPAMRSQEIAQLVAERVAEQKDLLVCANLSNCDMIGHLLPQRFVAAVQAYEAVDRALAVMVDAAAANGYHVILTSDHGNVEDDTPSHSVNDVLTTVIPPASGPAEWDSRRPEFQARLFDIPWTIGRIAGLEDALAEHMRTAGGGEANDRFVGRPIAK